MKQQNFIPILISELQGIEGQWNGFLKEWEEDAPDYPFYLFLSEIAEFTVSNRKRIDLGKFFACVEKVFEEGNHYWKEACTVGLLEDIQGVLLREELDLNMFTHFFLPMTKDQWTKIESFWSHGETTQHPQDPTRRRH